jgi:uncharacterized peroxidase-related enzyme
MTSFKIHTPDSAPAAARETLQAVRQKYGFVPNLLGELAAAPSVLKAYVTLNALLANSSLRPIEQQVVLIAASVTNGCTYCVAAHTAGLKAAGLPDAQIDALRSGQPLADHRLQALRALTTAIVDRRGRITERELQPFLDAGFMQEQVLEVLLGVALKTLSNYSNHIAETPIDAQLQPFAWEPANA